MKTSWIAIIFIGLTDCSSRLRQILWRRLYNKIAKNDTSGKFVFMNYGYADEKEKSSLPLNEEDEPFRYYIQLYNHVVSNIDLTNKDVMEVGCGRGGGGSFLLRYKNLQSYTGIDLSEKAIAWCKKKFQFVNANWLQATADALPVLDNSFDVVVNVESSHCYPSMEKFLNEVHRILRPSGYLAFCDMRPGTEVKKLDDSISASGLNVLKKHDITPQVLHALDNISAVRDSQISSVFPGFLRQAFRDFAGVKNSAVYNMLKTGQVKYLCYLMQKKNT